MSSSPRSAHQIAPSTKIPRARQRIRASPPVEPSLPAQQHSPAGSVDRWSATRSRTPAAARNSPTCSRSPQILLQTRPAQGQIICSQNSLGPAVNLSKSRRTQSLRQTHKRARKRLRHLLRKHLVSRPAARNRSCRRSNFSLRSFASIELKKLRQSAKREHSAAGNARLAYRQASVY